MGRRTEGKLLPTEIYILQKAFRTDEGVYSYGLGQDYKVDAGVAIGNGTIYKSLRRLEAMGLLDRGLPVYDTLPVKIPYELTVLGVLAVGEALEQQLKAFEAAGSLLRVYRD